MALARAFLRGGRDLMIMDEPNAGLDAEAEGETVAAALLAVATVLALLGTPGAGWRINGGGAIARLINLRVM